MSKNDISKDVMAKIKQGDVRMKSRTYFAVLSALIVAVSLFAGTVMTYLFSVIFFWIRVESASGQAYGARRNLGEAIDAFPWWALVLSTVLLLGVVLLVRKYGALSRHRPVAVALVIVTVSILIGVALSSFGIGDVSHSKNNNNEPEYRGRNMQQKY